MFKNLHLKIFAFILAFLFWASLVSFDTHILQLPQKISVQAFNLGEQLALSEPLPEVAVTIRVEDATTTVTASDFEAYVDLRNRGAGPQHLPVSVTSRTSKATVVSVQPAEFDLVLEPVRQKIAPLVAEVQGNPASGFNVTDIALSKTQVTLSAAESVLLKIGKVSGVVKLDGREGGDITKPVEVVVYDKQGAVLSEIAVQEKDIEATLSITESEISKKVGVNVHFSSAVSDALMKKITVTPALVSVMGLRETLGTLDTLSTELFDLPTALGPFEKKLKLVLPAGVKLAPAEPSEVTVKGVIEGS